MIRLQRVTLLALHQYLGLGAELIASQHRGDASVSYNEPEKEESEGITDILLERLVMKGWEIYQGGRRNNVEILKLSELSYRAPGSCSVTASVCSLRSQCWTRWT